MLIRVEASMPLGTSIGSVYSFRFSIHHVFIAGSCSCKLEVDGHGQKYVDVHLERFSDL